MTHNELTWKFLTEFDVESAAQSTARAISVEHGLTPVSPAVGAQLALIAAATNATNMIEIGTGCGLSGLWLLAGAPEATLTSIDSEFEYHEAARELFSSAGYPASRVRLITGKALDVLPRMNENSYDVVLVDGDPSQIKQNVEHALRLVRIGGTVVVAHALLGGDLANPAVRTAAASGMRDVLAQIQDDETIVVALSPAGDGLLQFTKISS